jgi:hypothetical protein
VCVSTKKRKSEENYYFLAERFQNYTLNWNHRKLYGFEKAYNFGTILLFFGHVRVFIKKEYSS